MYLEYADLINGAYEEDLLVLQRHEANALRAIEDAMGEAKSFLARRYNMDSEYAKTGENRNAYLVKIIRDIALYNIYTIAHPSQMNDTRRLRYEDARRFLEQVYNKKADLAGLEVNETDTGGGSYIVIGESNTKRNNGD
ncbi:MAG: DUF1320 domain-containing protein [Bacteroidales bacterium]|jgi:phage gp36-like protein|nr:DUF1320 domain-containing protein [Bacteroidales bacterium]